LGRREAGGFSFRNKVTDRGAKSVESEMSRPDTITVQQAVAALTAAARKNFPSVEAELRAAGFGITGYEPIQGTPNIDTSIAADIGAAVEGRGIYHGPWQPRPNGVIVHAYSAADLLKEASGEQMLLTWYKARDEFARRNGGRRYGDGTEAALRDAVVKPAGTQGAYQDGDLVMGPQELLNGFAPNGENVRKGRNTFDLLSRSKNTALNKLSKTLRDASGSDNGRWSWSCTEGRGNPFSVRAVRLPVGNVGWHSKDNYRLGVLPFRFFRESHAVKAAGHLNI
jgi:hypothetical protein